MVSDIEGVFLNVEPQNKEFRMSKENKHFDIRNSLFDIRYSEHQHHQCKGPPLYDLLVLESSFEAEYRRTKPESMGLT